MQHSLTSENLSDSYEGPQEQTIATTVVKQKEKPFRQQSTSMNAMFVGFTCNNHQNLECNDERDVMALW